MTPVYNEYITFLKDNGIKIDLREGYLWNDKTILKAYNKKGELVKICKIKVNDDLSLELAYDNKIDYEELESWEETVERKKEELKEIENHSLKLIETSVKIFEDREIAVLSSGGKDSSIVTYLVKKLVDSPRIIFNNTTLDCADTYKHIKKENNLQIINPKEGFYKWREKNNFVPTRFARACCTIFKEGAMVETLSKEDKYVFFMGMRNQESNTRSGYGDVWKNDKWGSREWDAILPIRSWTEEQIWLYAIMENIDINPKYKKGYTRVGCAVACPFYSKTTWVLDRYWYPCLYNRWHEILENDFIENKKACVMNCTLEEYHMNWNGGAVRDEATEEVKEEFSKLQNMDRDISDKYFNKTCSCCGKKLKKDDIGMSMKYYGRQIVKFKCMKCIANEQGVKLKDIKDKAKEFKETGCALF